MKLKMNETLKKRLLYQSQHRGMKEMDLLLGEFARYFLHTMNVEELLAFEDLLAFPDQELYGWFFEKAPIPEDAPHELIKMLDGFVTRIKD